ncbi:hypothetical protein L226DRAFT_536875 [Lentinus tigrinus ALCF2SS1-7]|uniref:F-box domain-containing protein n=1 Tax=Lentinus tigrinus ALCF2SS1-6 TaxID=1328759 RepID=A0A5C2RNR1_9APHY|nr:hypothetical protein L227DRAFT_658327 [Lentinus tigrinus ALCF2SS1-6]RPD72689.1 hypothetical protein L226DRAFT_536875 [Lentinus tigrinus ALCF2SS1-7]
MVQGKSTTRYLTADEFFSPFSESPSATMVQGKSTTVRHLIPELWRPIVGLLPPRDRLSCLSVSHMLHDIAVPLVFEHVLVAYGIPSDCRLLFEHINPYEPLPRSSDKVLRKRARAARSTAEFLRYIAATPHFAWVVKRLTVRAISLEPESVDCTDLVNALRACYNLQSFSWLGNSPYIPKQAIHAIKKSGAPLTEIRIPLWNPATTALARLRNLRAIWLNEDLRIDTMEERNREAPPRENPNTIIQANSNTLRTLSVFGAVSRWRVPIESLVHLTEFECIWPDGDSEFIASVLDRCTQLRSLMLGVGPVDMMEGDIVAVLRSRASSLPGLTSFKVSMGAGCSRPTTIALVDALAVFLKNKTALRRLDVNIRGIDEGIPGLDAEDGCPLEQIVKLLPSFPKLEVFGLTLARMTFIADDFVLLDRNIPRGVTALFLNLSIRDVGTGIRPALFANFFRKRKRLQYVHFVDQDGRWILFDALRTMCPRSVELLGYGGKMYWTVPNAAGKKYGVQLASRWSAMQLWFHTVDDFAGREDWEWLVRHRNTDIMPSR